MINIIKTKQGMNELYDFLSVNKDIGFDTETTSLYPRRGYIRLMQFSNGTDTFVVDCFKVGKEDCKGIVWFLSTFSIPCYIQNSKFDQGWLYYHYGEMLSNVFDTYLAAKVLDKGEDEGRRYNLDALATHYLGESVSKELQTSNWADDNLSDDQIAYAAKDAATVYKLGKVLEDKLQKNNLMEAAKTEFEAAKALALMEITGFGFDIDKWNETLKYLDQRAQQIHDEIYHHFVAKNGILFPNMDSPSQMLAVFQGAGINIKSTSDLALKRAGLNSELVQKFQEYRHQSKLATGFTAIGDKYYDPEFKRVFSSYNQLGAKSGRITSNSPNLQQIPREGGLRECFCAAEGNTLIIADYSQIELRVLAEISGDTKFIDMFNEGKDFHRMTAALVLNKKEEDITNKERYFAKQLNFGLVYGIGPKSFSVRSGIDLATAEDLITRYFQTFPELTVYLRDSGRLGLIFGESSAYNGFTRKIPESLMLKDMEHARRIAVNMRIQSSAAVIMKSALSQIYNLVTSRVGDVKLVNNIHDEVILECKTELAEDMSKQLVEKMKSAASVLIKSIPVEVDYVISKNWIKG
jgi:DNA polymerase-1